MEYNKQVIFVEEDTELYSLKSHLENNESYWFIQWTDPNKHPLHSHISFLVILIDKTIYVIGLDHVDLSPLKYTDIITLLQVKSKKFVFRLKESLHLLDLPDSVDIDSYWFLRKKHKIEYDSIFYPLYSVYHKHNITGELNKTIPIVKWVEYIELLFDKYKVTDSISGLDWYSSTYLPTLKDIEKNGLWVNRYEFIKRFPSSTLQITKEDKVYTQYNPYTLTGRPSNTHGGVNYLALNKEDGTRSIFHSNGGIFYQLDYDAHHLRLIGKLVKEEIPLDREGHEWMAEQYGCDTKTSKSITWRLLYGGIDEEFLVIPFYKKTQEYIDSLWEQSIKQGYLQTRYKNIPLDWIVEKTPQKLFNYQLQSLELEKNIDTVSSIIPTIKQKNIYLLLYTYDSYLFWMETPNDTEIDLLKKTLETGNFPIKIKKGQTLNDL